MKFSPLILVIIAFFSVVLLYQLPKSIVDNKDKSVENKKQATQETSKDSHSQMSNWSEKTQKEYEKIVQKYNKANEKEQISWTDSLIVFFKTNMKFDSAAYYQEKIALKNDNIQNWQKAGDSFYEAFKYAVSIDEKKAVTLAEKTQKYYEKIVAQNPNDLDTKANLAMTYIFDKNPMKPVLTLKDNLDKNENHELTLLHLGMLAIRSGQLDKAVIRFEKIIQLNPKNFEAKIYLADVWIKQNKKQDAKKILEEIAGLKDEKFQNWKQAAEEYLKQL
ncbi:MAG: hypothetical protein EAZ44_03260 [Cytophagia bacterium]|nr:MAG: hypothetical protein EAZ44_03260 [Cytophagia bacterium]TAG44006.1 MAG: hypothetical protein EAZ31_03105 [Cytophagia bacterium]TAH30988.1 MAG: hypothetical protein EAZ06_01375 [Cytophagales bacterium]